jgi:hypothetical protein
MSGSIDSDKGFVINNGNLLAVGYRGMIENPSYDSKQNYVNINLSSKTTLPITIYDESNNEILSFQPKIDYQSIVISLSKFERNKIYKFKIGEEIYQGNLEKIGIALGTNSSGNLIQGLIEENK